MTLFSLARKNVQRNFSNYFLYIASMVFSIIIYFTFVTLKYNNDVLEAAGSSQKISSLMSVSSVLLLLFIVIFIAYSNSFFMKKRKKEVALYSLLGVRKQKIGLMLFFENLVIGLIALVLGIGLGFLLSKFILTILIRLMGYSITASFTLSGAAVLQTVIVFGLVFLFTSFQGYRVIYAFKLIDLFHADKQGESVPKASFLTAIFGVLSIAAGYFLALQDIMTSQFWRILGFTMPFVIIFLTVLGTYLLFHSVSVFVLTGLKKWQSWSWKGLNLMTVSQLLYRIRGNAKSLTIIAVLSATTITAGGAVFGLYYNIEKGTNSMSPNTFMWQGQDTTIDAQKVAYHKELNVKQVELTIDDQGYHYYVLSESDYNALAKAQQKDEITNLQANELIVLDQTYDERWSTDYSGKTAQLATGENVTITEQRPYSVLNMRTAGVVAVVADAYYDNLTSDLKKMQVYGLHDSLKQIEIARELSDIMPDEAYFSSAPSDYEAMVASMGAMLFVGSFLGLVFLTATGSIIYFKIITEAEEDKAKYVILHKVGVSSRQMLKTISAQVGIIFGVPLLLGLSHAAFALMGFSGLLGLSILRPVLIWMLAYAVIYGIYYIITVRTFYKIVQKAKGE